MNVGMCEFRITYFSGLRNGFSGKKIYFQCKEVKEGFNHILLGTLYLPANNDTKNLVHPVYIYTAF